MNTQNILDLADFIETQKDYPFDMASVCIASRETSGCIYGFGVALWETENDDIMLSTPVGKKLGLSSAQADMLFFPGEDVLGPNFNKISRADAVATLRHLAATGTVKWNLEP